MHQGLIAVSTKPVLKPENLTEKQKDFGSSLTLTQETGARSHSEKSEEKKQLKSEGIYNSVVNHVINSPEILSQQSHSPGVIPTNIRTPLLKSEGQQEGQNMDVSMSVYNLREYKGPVVSFLDDDNEYYSQKPLQVNFEKKYNYQPHQGYATQNEPIQIQEPRLTNNSYLSKDISTIQEESQEFSEAKSDRVSTFDEGHYPQEFNSAQNLDKMSHWIKTGVNLDTLSPVLEQRSAEDRFDSTGYIFQSRLGRCSLDPVLEQQRSKATSFDPQSGEHVQQEMLNGIRLRRATLGEPVDAKKKLENRTADLQVQNTA